MPRIEIPKLYLLLCPRRRLKCLRSMFDMANFLILKSILASKFPTTSTSTLPLRFYSKVAPSSCQTTYLSTFSRPSTTWLQHHQEFHRFFLRPIATVSFRLSINNPTIDRRIVQILNYSVDQTFVTRRGSTNYLHGNSLNHSLDVVIMLLRTIPAFRHYLNVSNIPPSPATVRPLTNSTLVLDPNILPRDVTNIIVTTNTTTLFTSIKCTLTPSTLSVQVVVNSAVLTSLQLKTIGTTTLYTSNKCTLTPSPPSVQMVVNFAVSTSLQFKNHLYPNIIVFLNNIDCSMPILLKWNEL